MKTSRRLRFGLLCLLPISHPSNLSNINHHHPTQPPQPTQFIHHQFSPIPSNHRHPFSSNLHHPSSSGHTCPASTQSDPTVRSTTQTTSLAPTSSPSPPTHSQPAHHQPSEGTSDDDQSNPQLLPKLLSFSEWKAKDRSTQNSRRHPKKYDHHEPLLKDHHPPHPTPSSTHSNHTPFQSQSQSQPPPPPQPQPHPPSQPDPSFPLQPNLNQPQLQPHPPHTTSNSNALNPLPSNHPSWSRVSNAVLQTISEGQKFANGLIRSNPTSLMTCQSDRLSSSHSVSNSLQNLSHPPPTHHPRQTLPDPHHLIDPHLSAFQSSSFDHPDTIYYSDSNTGTGNTLDPLNTLSTRTNYASFDCSASIHRSSKQAKSASAILNEKKDKYMLMPCVNKPSKGSSQTSSKRTSSSSSTHHDQSNNFVVFELCDEIEIDHVVLANFEFFSSMFKLIKMSVSNSGLEGAGGAEWTHVGFLKTRNARGLQIFPIKHLKGFYRYVRFDFLTHYGTEYYCPLSLVRIYGLTQIDAYRRDEKLQQRSQVEDEFEEHEGEDAQFELEPRLQSPPQSQPDHQTNLVHSDRKLNASERVLDSNQFVHRVEPSNPPSSQASQTAVDLNSSSIVIPDSGRSSDKPEEIHQDSNQPSPDQVLPSSPDSAVIPQESSRPDKAHFGFESNGRPPTDNDIQAPPLEIAQPQPYAPDPSFSSPSPPTDSVSSHSSPKPPQQDEVASANPEKPLATQDESAEQPVQLDSSNDANTNSQTDPLLPLIPTVPSIPSAREGKRTVSNPEVPRTATASKSTYPEKQYLPNGSTTGQSSESIFGQIMKRLNNLESNHELTLKYIEDQVKVLESSIHRLDERFVKLDKVLKLQATKSRKMMNEFNSIKSKFSLENSYLNHRIESLDSSITLIKRFGLIQFISILTILIFLGLTRFQHTPTSTSPSSTSTSSASELTSHSKQSRYNSEIKRLDSYQRHPLGLGRIGRKNLTILSTRTPGGSGSPRNSPIARRRPRYRFRFYSSTNEVKPTTEINCRANDQVVKITNCEGDQDRWIHDHCHAHEQKGGLEVDDNDNEDDDPDLTNEDLNNQEQDLTDGDQEVILFEKKQKNEGLKKFKEGDERERELSLDEEERLNQHKKIIIIEKSNNPNLSNQKKILVEVEKVEAEKVEVLPPSYRTIVSSSDTTNTTTSSSTPLTTDTCDSSLSLPTLTLNHQYRPINRGDHPDSLIHVS